MEEYRNPEAIQLKQEEDVEKIFKKFDANGDGKISSAELGAVLNGLGCAASDEEVARIMYDLDSDGDGFIDLAEFKAFHCGGCDGGELKEAFDLYDKDKDGQITAVELQSVLQSVGEKCSLEDCRRMISSFDVDGDGCVNFDEFKKMMMAGAP